jgi:hypothetical protein
VSITVYEACACGASFTADGLVDHLDTRSALTEWRQEHQHDVTVSALRTEVERLRDEAASGPSWDAVALRSALVAMTVERDEARAEVDRLDRDGRAVAGRCLHYEARAVKAEAAIARVRALCDEAGSLAFTGVTEGGWLHYEAVEAALDGGDDGE